jgi:hypothetical protein
LPLPEDAAVFLFLKEEKHMYRKRLIALLLAVALTILVPTAAFAAEAETLAGFDAAEAVGEALPADEAEPPADAQDDETPPVPLGAVTVVVENTTYAAGGGAPWDGVLFHDGQVPIFEDSDMMSAILAALDRNHISYDYNSEYAYLQGVGGLEAGMGAPFSGWMVSLNDWFTSEGAAAYTVANGGLRDGDVIRVMHTMDFSDLGGDYSDNSKAIKDITFSTGTLNAVFDSGVARYVLTVPEGTESVFVTPTAQNKNFQVRTTADGVEYARPSGIPVGHGTKIVVTCGDPSWPTMNDAADVPAERYTILVKTGDRPLPPMRNDAVPDKDLV